MRLFVFLLWWISPSLIIGQLHINEVMPQNTNTISDNFGQYDDWIEIYNDGPTSVDLSGYYLTDDLTNLNKHEIDSGNSSLTVVAAGGFQIFWADENSSQGENHLNFKISDGESIALVAPDGQTIVSVLTLPSLKDDESYGRVVDGGSTFRIFEVSTPNDLNTQSEDANIAFSQTSKAFVNSFNLTLSTTAAGGNLRYTTNGSNPTSSSPSYPGPINISETTTVKAAYFFNNGTVSLVKSERYVKMSSGMVNRSSDLPIVLIHTYNEVLNPDDFKTTFLSVIEPINNGRANGGDTPSFAGRSQMKVRGASTQNLPKRQWRVEIQNEDGSDKDVSLLGMPSDSDWVLYAPGRHDKGLINNALMYEMSRRLGKWAPRTRFVEVYYNEGNSIDEGDYWGIYILMENIKVDNNRADINKLESNENSGDDLTGGYLYSLNWTEDFTTNYTENYYGSATIGYELHAPDIDEISTTQLDYIKSTITSFETSLTSNDWLNPISGYKSKTNIDSWMTPHLLRALAKEPDGFHLSHYMQKDKNGLIEAGPLWDFDRAINSTDTRSADYFGWDTSAPGSPSQGNCYYWKGGVNSGAFINQMVEDPDYETLIYDRWFEWRRNNILKTSEIHGLIDSMANRLTESQVREFNRWSSVQSGYAPRYGGFSGEINAMKSWFENRANWIDGEFLPQAGFNPMSSNLSLNSTVTLSNTIGNGTIYYTNDGSDPRLAGGAISPTAIQYTGPIQVSKSGMNYITARILTSSGTWGAICTQQYYVSENYDGLVINEIHYNPHDEIVSGDTISGRNFEFIELKNCSDRSINLNGIDFDLGGVDLDIKNCLTIAPGGFIVFAEDADWFQYKYGFAPDAEYKEKLDDGGELLFLTNPLEELIDSVRYNDNLPWPGTADKGFYSLALKDCSLDNYNPLSWAIQSVFTTPGAENYFTDFGVHGFSGLVINEIHYNPFDGSDNAGNIISGTNYEFVEIKNISEAPIELSDVFFSRGIEYFFPINTFIQPGELIVLAENPIRFQERYGFAPFDSYSGKLSDLGESIWIERITESGSVLLDAVTYDDAFPWDPNANGGFTDNSVALIDGTVNNDTYLNWQVQCNTLYTPGNDNDFSCFQGLDYDGLVINEFHYSPAEGNDHEFIEILNSSAVLMNLDQVAFTAGIRHLFNQFYLGPGQSLILARDSILFSNTYGINPTGQYVGGMSSNGERIELSDLFGSIIDEVTYGVASPWNAEPLQGNKSLALIDPSMDNNLPESWCIQEPNLTPRAQNIFADSDFDNVIDCVDICPNFNDALLGKACDDGDPCTIGEKYSANCLCEGGVGSDSDNDGICDFNDQCPGVDDAIVGQPCDDGDICTDGETYNSNCQCAGGAIIDSDFDGICDALDQCPSKNDNLIGLPCDDGDRCTSGEIYNSLCNCTGGVFNDSDSDGVCDFDDMCPGFDDDIDINNNGIPDGCESCENFIVEDSYNLITKDRSANFNITTNGFVPSTENIIYKAGESIDMTEGFEITIGAVFVALIGTCD